MGWKDRFQVSRGMVDRSKEIEKSRIKQIKHDRKSTSNLLIERKKAVGKFAPHVEKVLKQYHRAVKGNMTKLKPREWDIGNAGWILQMWFGGVKAEIWPWVSDKDKPRLLKGVWLQFLGPNGENLIVESTVEGKKLGRYYELGTEEAYWPGYYYWIVSGMSTRPHCAFGYFIPLDEFSEEKLAKVLDDISYNLPRLKNHFV